MTIVLDTGPLVAALRRDDRHHAWARSALASVRGPFLTCEAVLAEASHLLRRHSGGHERLFGLLDETRTRLPFRFEEHVREVRALMAKYVDVPMSFADACLVRMPEGDDSARIITLDSDFHVYRKRGRRPIPLITPDEV